MVPVKMVLFAVLATALVGASVLALSARADDRTASAAGLPSLTRPAESGTVLDLLGRSLAHVGLVDRVSRPCARK